MSKVFFTGCTHFNHENIIDLASRPFANTHEMNEKLVENWNKAVKPNDEVFHLGDVAWDIGFGPRESVEYWMGRLHGRKTLIVGNHDRELRWDSHKMGYWGFREIYNYLDLKRNGKHFILFHYPMEDWDGRYRGSIHLHCHTHQKLLERPLLPHIRDAAGGLALPDKYPKELLCNRFNVTVEATNYTPISMDEIIALSEYRNG